MRGPAGLMSASVVLRRRRVQSVRSSFHQQVSNYRRASACLGGRLDPSAAVPSHVCCGRLAVHPSLQRQANALDQARVAALPPGESLKPGMILIRVVWGTKSDLRREKVARWCRL